jgi:hypothetical protein
LGEHSEDILRELGYSASEIADFRQSGAVQGSAAHTDTSLIAQICNQAGQADAARDALTKPRKRKLTSMAAL